MTAEDDVDTLYGVPPEEFMALRKQLVAAAKKRGDADAAKLVGAARRPTAAAWVVNSLVRHDATARVRLSELTEALRAAHSTMDGARIRELTAVQRKLIDQLVRTGLAATGQAGATAALRNDVTDTLQAAIADPDVFARLGRLEKAERWSGFGDFGISTAVGLASPRKRATPAPAAAVDEPDAAAALEASRMRRDDAAAEVDAAQAARAESDDLVTEQKGRVATARRRYEKLLESLNAAERELTSADASLGVAEQHARETTDRLEAAKGELAQAERALRDITG